MIIECHHLMGRPVTESERLLSNMNETLFIWHKQRALLVEDLSTGFSPTIVVPKRTTGP
jgi:hypothetical protein